MGKCVSAEHILKYYSSRKLSLVNSTHEDAITITKLKAIAKYIDFDRQSPLPIHFTMVLIDGDV